METIQREQCKTHHLYSGIGRNFNVAVCSSKLSVLFVGRRIKSGGALLFEETHGDVPHGTFRPTLDLGPLSLESVKMFEDFHQARERSLTKFHLLSEKSKESQLTREEREKTDEFMAYSEAKTAENKCEQRILDWLLDIETQLAKSSAPSEEYECDLNYEVSWIIDIVAKSPYEAAFRAREIQLDPASIATHFSVNDVGSSNFATQVDLLEPKMRPYKIEFSNGEFCDTAVFAESFESARIIGARMATKAHTTARTVWLINHMFAREAVATYQWCENE